MSEETLTQPTHSELPTREELAGKYKQLFEQATEKTTEWYVYGHAHALIAGTSELSWVRDELTKARLQSLEYAVAHGHYPDHGGYGTYGNYMRTKASLYDDVLKDLALVETIASAA